MNELVTAIVTTYGRDAEIVCRAINSILSQTYNNIEIILVNDNLCNSKFSIDLEKALTRYRDNNIIYIKHTNNKGACVARNTGLKFANGEYIAYLDDDDEWLPQKIEKQLDLFSDDIGLVYGRGIFIIENKNIFVMESECYHSGFIYEKLILTNFIGGTSNPLIKKNVLEKIKFDPAMKSAQDYDVWLQIAKKYKMQYLNEPVVKYHIHKQSRISTNKQNKIEGGRLLNEKNHEYLVKNSKAWRVRYISLAKKYAYAREIKKSLLTWKLACKNHKNDTITNIIYLLYVLREMIRK